MVRRKIKWKFGFLFSIILLNVFTKSLPIEKSEPNLPFIVTTDTYFENIVLPNVPQTAEIETANSQHELTLEELLISNETSIENIKMMNSTDLATNYTSKTARNLLRQLRPGQDVRQYTVAITFNGQEFRGRAVIDVRLTLSTTEDPILLHVEDLNIDSVLVGIVSEQNASPADFDLNDGILEITPNQPAASYMVIVEYSGAIRNDGTGIFYGDFNNQAYIGMNLYSTHARRVFPCVDELSVFSTVMFTFNDVPFNIITVNSAPQENTITEFRALQGPVHLWGMIAHDFPTIVIPVTNVILYGRPGMNQDGQAAVAIQSFFNMLNEWTNKEYFDIIVNQDGRMSIVALPDTSVDWYALSTVCIWEPYVYMEPIHSINQRKTALVKIAESMAHQWFGYVIYPDNWRNQWVISGLNTYAAYEAVKAFQTDPNGIDESLLDMNTLFVTDIIQEGLLRDGYATATSLIPTEELEQEEHIRDHINGLLKYKAPALLRMLRLILGNEENDYIQQASQSLLNRWSLEPISSTDLYDALNDVWMNEPNKMIEDIKEYLEPWVTVRGYPLITVGLNQGGILITQQHYGFTTTPVQSYEIPITYTTSINMDFSNVHPTFIKGNTITLPLALGDEDFVLFNIQGQGYYRVDYDLELWERIIEGLKNPDVRNNIHPLNRATLVDDALNVARAGNLNYDVAFRVVLAMEHETEYAPWKAFVRNMNFLRKRLVALVTNDEDLDPDIYLRMVRRTIGAFEENVGFYPNPSVFEPAMVSLTRGLVMDHACRANYDPCIAAAVDWFYDPNSDEPTVNPDIPKDIRPAVYCTMVREGDAQVINALYDRLEIEPSHYERVVILESLGCSQDENFISSLLLETIADGSPYGVEERSKIFAAVAESSYENAGIAINFMRMYTNEIRNTYGGPQKLEELLKVLADNAADDNLVFDLTIWIDSINSNIDESIDLAERLREQAKENLIWDQLFLENVYEWIDENDAPKMVVSFVLLAVTICISLFNH